MGKEECMKFYTIRTADNRTIVFDAYEQVKKDGIIEFHFPYKWLAEELLKNMEKAYPEQKFILIEKEIDPKDAVVTYTEEDIHQKAMEKEYKA